MSKKKNPEDLEQRGRKTKYAPEFCEMLIAHMAKGYSYASFGAIADCHVDTLYEWEKVHPEFSEAKSRGEAKSLYWWETQGIEGIFDITEREEFEDGRVVSKTKRLNGTNYVFSMSNKHKWTRTDRREDDQVEKEIRMLAYERVKQINGSGKG